MAMNDAQKLIDKASDFLTAAVKAQSHASHDAKINIAQTASLISIAISLNKIAEDGR